MREKTRLKKHILLVDDHAILREGLIQLINREPDMEVRGEAPDAQSAKAEIEANPPDLVILDISLRGANGLALLEEIHRERPGLPVLILSMHKESLYAERAIRAGARGYIMKEETTTSLVTAIRRVLAGGVFLSGAMNESILLGLSNPRKTGASPVDSLSNRELEIFKLLGEGYRPRQIADRLCVSVKTVESYISRIKNKLELDSAAELSRRAIEWRSMESG